MNHFSCFIRKLIKGTLAINFVFTLHFSFAQNNSISINKSSLQEDFICATGFYSFKVVDGKIITMQTGYPDTDKTLISLPLPSDIGNFKKVKSVSSGASHLMLLTGDGKVFTYGSNRNGQLGYINSSEEEFLQVKGLPKIKEISAGRYHCLALDYKGNVYSWGNNSTGQLGDGTSYNRHSPAKINNFKNIVSIAAGTHHNLALDKDSMVWAWGHNSNGQLGDGTYENKYIPVRVKDMDNTVAIRASVSSYALKSNGSLWSWGYNGFGQLGNKENEQNSNIPNPVSVLPAIVSVECGLGHCVALDQEGNIWTWGYNSCGQLGDGSLDSRSYPLRILSNCIAISAGSYHNLFLGSDFTIYATGTIRKPDFIEEDSSELGYVFPVEKLMYEEGTIEIIISSE